MMNLESGEVWEEATFVYFDVLHFRSLTKFYRIFYKVEITESEIVVW